MWALTGAWGVLYPGHILVPNPQIPPHVTHSTANVAHSSHRIMRKALHSATVIGVSEGNMTARAEYRKRTQQRQTVVFGSILATMGVLLLLSMLVWSGIMPPAASSSVSSRKHPIPTAPLRRAFPQNLPRPLTSRRLPSTSTTLQIARVLAAKHPALSQIWESPSPTRRRTGVLPHFPSQHVSSPVPPELLKLILSRSTSQIPLLLSTPTRPPTF